MSIQKTLIVASVFFCLPCFAQDTQKNNNQATYDSLLAKKLGADEYGMKTYVMAFLRSGPTRIQDSVQRAQLQLAHLKNIQRLAAEKKLIIAGPFLDNQSIRGIFVFDVNSVEEAERLTATDPAVKAGTLSVELHPWYGSAALMETVRIHKAIEKNNVAD